MPSENRDSFTSSFSIWMHFLPFSYLVVMARTFNTLLNKSGKGGRLSLVLDLKAESFQRFIVEYIRCGLVISGLYYIEVCSLYTHLLKSF